MAVMSGADARGNLGADQGADIDVVIALKHLSAAKSRLAPLFDSRAREDVVLAMLLDTIVAALSVDAIRSVTVVTPDRAAAKPIRECGAAVLADPTPPRHPDPLNHAIRAAIATLSAKPNIAVLQGDLPALRPAELSEAVSCARAHPRSFVTDTARNVAVQYQGILPDLEVKRDEQVGHVWGNLLFPIYALGFTPPEGTDPNTVAPSRSIRASIACSAGLSPTMPGCSAFT